MLRLTHRSDSFLLRIGLLIVCLFAIAGCSTSSTQNQPAAPAAETPAAPASTSTNTTIAVKDAYGTVQVPAAPTKIVVLDIGALDNLLALGVKPVGAPSILNPGDPFPKYLSGAEGIQNIGSVNEPNLEAIDSIKPDLIIGNKDTHDQIHSKLAQIAPTVFVESLGVTWKDNLLVHAQAVNKPEEGKKLLEDYNKKIAELKGKLDKLPSKPQVSLFRPREDKIQIYSNHTFSGTILADAGLERPAVQQIDSFSKDVTEEQIADLDADVMFWFSRDNSFYEKLQKNSLWGTLHAVKANSIHQVDWETWMSGLGIQAVNSVINDLNKHLIAQ
ncbi:ABC transporter substrate-binding protein [uncultured Brevibacillus sp.]|uniref:ABC transporter substrate-binding protein n=1 Tax=uncultured Brevibacillus sp. TaxID=169970 RepID=UPI0025952ABD|nr:iron-siderophore ABC transporter substrate-binding protein [uncultured Brevibacillus sp.]